MFAVEEHREDGWTVMGYAHVNCKACKKESESGIIMARVTGSTGSTHLNGEHGAKVMRTRIWESKYTHVVTETDLGKSITDAMKADYEARGHAYQMGLKNAYTKDELQLMELALALFGMNPSTTASEQQAADELLVKLSGNRVKL